MRLMIAAAVAAAVVLGACGVESTSSSEHQQATEIDPEGGPAQSPLEETTPEGVDVIVSCGFASDSASQWSAAYESEITLTPCGTGLTGEDASLADGAVVDAVAALTAIGPVPTDSPLYDLSAQHTCSFYGSNGFRCCRLQQRITWSGIYYTAMVCVGWSPGGGFYRSSRWCNTDGPTNGACP